MEPSTWKQSCHHVKNWKLVLVIFTLTDCALGRTRTSAAAGPGAGHDVQIDVISPPALIIFGDSIADTGNNNRQLTYLKSNYPPYGQDFVDQRATGRFCNGRLVTDYVAQKLGLPYPLPYLRDTANSDFQPVDYTKGVNFASGGSGWLSTTTTFSGAVAISKQMDYFDDYIATLKNDLGEEAANELLAESLYVISLGSNDYLSYIDAVTRLIYPAQYADKLLAVAQNTIEEVHRRGGRRIAVVGLVALGCLPLVRQLLGHSSTECVQSMNDHVSLYNTKLDLLVARLRRSLDDVTLVHVVVYPFFLQLFQNHQQYGLTQVQEPCCGMSKLSGRELDLSALQPLLCLPYSRVCANASTYLFWDSLHLTEAAYQLIADYVFPAFISLLVPGYELPN